MTLAERIAAEAAAQKRLDTIGYTGDAITYRARKAVIDELAREDLGPGAMLTRWLKRLAVQRRR